MAPQAIAGIIVLEAIMMVITRGVQATIAGLTFMDNMDFQERFRNVHECDPFYYHPLHLPEYCADMFEKLIRSRIGSRGAVRILKENSSPESRPRQYRINQPDYDYYEYSDDTLIEYRELTPSEQMYNSLKRDVQNNPSSGELMWTNFGPVAVYEQPISKASKKLFHRLYKQAMPKQKKAKRNGRKVDFTFGKNKIQLEVAKNDDYFVLQN